MTSEPGRARAAGISLFVVLAATPSPWGRGPWSRLLAPRDRRQDGRQYRRFCYSDLVPLFGTEHLQGGRLPYLDRASTPGSQCDEYPVLTMYLMRLGAWVSSGYAGFFWANAACCRCSPWQRRPPCTP